MICTGIDYNAIPEIEEDCDVLIIVCYNIGENSSFNSMEVLPGTECLGIFTLTVLF